MSAQVVEYVDASLQDITHHDQGPVYDTKPWFSDGEASVLELW